jgi:hypothetical protein
MITPSEPRDMADHIPMKVFSAEPVTIYVESRYDAALYQLLCGAPENSGLRFIEPFVDRANPRKEDNSRGGFRSVRDATRADRANAKNGASSFGLLDGEEAARFGRGNELFDSPNLIFALDDERTNGLFFLGCFEKENLYLRYGSALKMMKNRFAANLRAGNSKARVAIDPAFDAATRASIAKCAAKPIISSSAYWTSQSEANLVEAEVFSIIDGNLFGGKPNGIKLMAGAEGAWPNQYLRNIFSNRVKELHQFCGVDLVSVLTTSLANRNLLSVCNGVAMLRMVLDRDRDHTYEDMAADLLDMGFGIEFRMALMAAIRGDAIHVPSNERVREFNSREPLAIRLMDKLRP